MLLFGTSGSLRAQLGVAKTLINSQLIVPARLCMAAPAAGSAPPPKVGVGVVILRHLRGAPGPEVLLIRRGKRPSKGMWSFCGGSLELGETMVECAAREALEETALRLRNRPSPPGAAPGPGSLLSRSLDRPAVFTAVDVIERDEDGSIAYHYAVVEVAAVPEDPRAAPCAGDDADEARWFAAAELRGLPDLVPNAVEVVDEALARFDLPLE